jgi:hypothetical protein
VKRLLLIVVAVAVAFGAEAATVVLKGGKKLDVSSFKRQGNYLVVKLPDGRTESYPMAAVDLDATQAANETATGHAPAPTAPPSGPHSPFFGAQSNPGKPVVVVTDNDVQHVTAPDEAEPGAKPKAVQGATSEGEVVLVDYTRNKVDDGDWEVTATVVNKGGSPVTGVSGDVRLLDAKGASIGTGTATMAGTLAPGQQGSLTAKVACPVEPVQIGFSFRWTSVTPQPTPAPSPAAAAPAPAAKPPEAASRPPGYSVPPGSSPNTLASNPMAVPTNLTAPPTALQIARGTAPQKQ